MTPPPKVCPSPPSCPAYVARLDYAQDESLRRALLMERRKGDSLASLIRADSDRQYQRPAPAPPTRPELPAPSPDLTGLIQKGVNHA